MGAEQSPQPLGSHPGVSGELRGLAATCVLLCWGGLLGNKAKCLKVRGKRPSAECWTRGGELSLSFPASLSARRRSWSAPQSPGSGREAAPEDPRGSTAPGPHPTPVLVAQGPAAAHSPAPTGRPGTQTAPRKRRVTQRSPRRPGGSVTFCCRALSRDSTFICSLRSPACSAALSALAFVRTWAISSLALGGVGEKGAVVMLLGAARSPATRCQTVLH